MEGYSTLKQGIEEILSHGNMSAKCNFTLLEIFIVIYIAQLIIKQE